MNLPSDVKERCLSIPLGTTTSWITWEALALLHKAENLFGGRDRTFEYAGVAFSEDGPQIRFSPQEDRVCIELSWGALASPNQIRYQVGHEIVHVLSPSKKTVMLEEGLAVWFSIYGPDYHGTGYDQFALEHLRNRPEAKNYADALALYNELRRLNRELLRDSALAT